MGWAVVAVSVGAVVIVSVWSGMTMLHCVLSFFFFSSRRRHTRSVSAFLLNRSSDLIGISQSTFSVKVLNLFSRSRRKTNKRKSKHSAMLRNKETRHRMFIGLLNTTRKLA